jgi:cyclin-dependent kinase regulatory subunit CKS1
MSKYNQKPFTQEEKKKAIEQYSEKIQYSPRYNSAFGQLDGAA